MCLCVHVWRCVCACLVVCFMLLLVVCCHLANKDIYIYIYIYICLCVGLVVRLMDAIDDMKQVIMDSAQFLLTADKSHYSYSDAGSIFDVVRVPDTTSF